MQKTARHILVTISIIFPVYILVQLFVPIYNGAAPLEIEIPQGATYTNAMDILAEHKLIRGKFLFRALGMVTGADRRMRAGYYRFWSGISPFDVFQQLRKGKIIEYEITIVEGDSLLEISEKLEAKKFVAADVFNALARDKSILDSLRITSPSIEGYLFPETYKFPKGARPEDIIRLMVGKLRESYTDEIKARMQQIGWSENDILTLASIIEKEAQTDEERPVISAVYHNRLKMDMPLQSDPTAIYGVKSSKNKIISSDLKNKTPFNTYVIKGLPPGPIASPGLKSIMAALSPAKVPYIYFVARGNGTHLFTSSLADHNIAVGKVRATARIGAATRNSHSND